jgi:hypothetical protein
MPVLGWKLFFLRFFFNVQDFPALVKPTIGANSVGQAHLATIAALHNICGGQ